MAAFPICHKIVYKDQNLPIQSITRQNDKKPTYGFGGLILRRSHSSFAVGDLLTKSNTRERVTPRCLGHAGCCFPRVCGPPGNIRFIQGCCYSEKAKVLSVRCSSEFGTNEKQLRSLDSYFGKLQDDAKLLLSPLSSSDQVMQVCQRKGESVTKNGLKSLDAYLGKLNNGKYKFLEY